MPSVPLRVYIASRTPEDGEGLTNERVGPNGQNLFLDSRSLITSQNVTRARLDTHAVAGQDSIVVELDARGEEIMRTNASRYVHRFLAIVWHDRLINAPVVQSPLGKLLLITADPTSLPGEELKQIMDELNEIAATRSMPE